MTGSEALKIARAAVRFAKADKRRKEAADAVASMKPLQDPDPEELANRQAYLRSCASACGGYKRGLLSAARAVVGREGQSGINYVHKRNEP